MVRHIVCWNFKDGFTDEQNAANAARFKAAVEALADIIPGTLRIGVYYNLLPSSKRQLVVDGDFESAEALAGYEAHPAHVAVIPLVREMFQNQVLLDYEL